MLSNIRKQRDALPLSLAIPAVIGFSLLAAAAAQAGAGPAVNPPLDRAVEAMEQRNYADAIRVLSDALEGEPSNTAKLYYLGKAYNRLGMFDRALAALQTADALGHATPHLQHELAIALLGVGRDGEGHYRLGLVLSWRGAFDEAKAAFEHAATADADLTVPAAHQLAMLDVRRGRLAEAQRKLQALFEQIAGDGPATPIQVQVYRSLWTVHAARQGLQLGAELRNALTDADARNAAPHLPRLAD